jgi:hypothetical protein
MRQLKISKSIVDRDFISFLEKHPEYAGIFFKKKEKEKEEISDLVKRIQKGDDVALENLQKK